MTLPTHRLSVCPPPPPTGLDPKDPSALARGFPAVRRTLAAATGGRPPPSPVWLVAAPAAQIPVFVTGILAVRRVAADGAALGLAQGGGLWFPDLTASAVDTARERTPRAASPTRPPSQLST